MANILNFYRPIVCQSERGVTFPHQPPSSQRQLSQGLFPASVQGFECHREAVVPRELLGSHRHSVAPPCSALRILFTEALCRGVVSCSKGRNADSSRRDFWGCSEYSASVLFFVPVFVVVLTIVGSQCITKPFRKSDARHP